MEEEEGEGRTRRKAFARSQLDLPPSLPQWMTWSASFWAALALGRVVVTCSWWRRDETRLRSMRTRWAVGRPSLAVRMPCLMVG